MALQRPVRRPLPRGAHGLSREFVAQDQRARMIDAMADVVAEHGYTEATVAHVLEEAKVSRRTFYEHFTDKEDCFLAAYDAVVSELMEQIGAAIVCDDEWPVRVRTGMAAFLGFLVAEPAFARMCLVESLAAGPDALARYVAAVRSLIPYLQEGREYAAHVEELPETLEETLAGGVSAILYWRVAAGQAAELNGLLPDLVYFVLHPYLGHDAALAESRSS